MNATLMLCLTVMAELIGVLLFALLGGTAPADLAPWANGFGIAVFVYITANISGGHLNPAVTLATLITGHITIAKAIAYVVAQTVGGILGVLLQVLSFPLSLHTCPFTAKAVSPSHHAQSERAAHCQPGTWQLREA